jgi:hypothetical protein
MSDKSGTSLAVQPTLDEGDKAWELCPCAALPRSCSPAKTWGTDAPFYREYKEQVWLPVERLKKER